MKLTKKQQKLVDLGMSPDNWLLTATKWDRENCICCEWDGKGVSCCGVPCPVHRKYNSLAFLKCWLKEFWLTISSGNPISGHDWVDQREYKRHGKLFTISVCEVCGKKEKLWRNY